MDLRNRIAKYIASPRGDLLTSNREELSHSRMSTMIRNPREHYLKYAKHLRYYKEKSSLSFGKIMHEVLAFYYSNGMNYPLEGLLDYYERQFRGYLEYTEFPIQYSKTELLDGIPRKQQEEMAALLESDPTYLTSREAVARENEFELGKKMLTTWYNTYAEEDSLYTETLEVEKPFWIPLITKSGRISQRYMLSGIIDRIYRDKRDGKIYVQDHKNLARKMADTTPGTSNQLSMYYLGAVFLGYLVDGACFNILYKLKEPTVDRKFTTRTDEQLEDFMEDANDVAKCISYGIKYKNYDMGAYGDFAEYLLEGKKETVVEFIRTPLKEKFLNGDLNNKPEEEDAETI